MKNQSLTCGNCRVLAEMAERAAGHACDNCTDEELIQRENWKNAYMAGLKTAQEALFIVREIQRSFDEESGSGFAVKFDERGWERMKRRAAK